MERKRRKATSHSSFDSFQPSSFRDIVLPTNSPSSNLTMLSDSVTVVTAYFNLGDFVKGYTNIFGPRLYHKWMTVFSRITNPLVVYFDTDSDATYFNIIRSNLSKHLTKVIKIDRSSLWAFALFPYIDEIYKRPLYPKHSPDTVRPDYSCAMHAKYELILRTVRENPFRTRYICWLDIGLFRDLVPISAVPSIPSGPPFQIRLPHGFDVSKIAYSEVSPRDDRHELDYIVSKNKVWVSGSFFIGRVDVVFRWALEYAEGVERMLERRWMSTDQQIIYWIYNKKYHTTEIQAYRDESSQFNVWFYVGYLSKAEIEQNRTIDSAD